MVWYVGGVFLVREALGLRWVGKREVCIGLQNLSWYLDEYSTSIADSFHLPRVT